METLQFLSEEIAVSKELNIPISLLFNKAATNDVVTARHLVWHFMVKRPGIVVEAIAYRYSKHYSTVLHGINKVEDQKGTYFKEYLQNLSKLI